jgi:PST family polysaccharide transporter/lipopolysaccharide exporter
MNLTEVIRSILSSDTLLGRSVKSMGVLAAASGMEHLFRLVRNIILVRILAPDAFGIMAAVTASVAVIEAFSEVGLKQNVIQHEKGADDEFLRIIYLLAITRSLFLYAIAYTAAPFIGEFFNRPDSTDILRVGFLVIPIEGAVSPRLTLLEKELNYRKWAIITQGSAFVGITVAIVSAFHFQNVWALIIGYVTESSIRCVASQLICPQRLSLRISSYYLREVLKFSRRIFGLPILMLLYSQTDTFVIGRVLSMELLGFYALAKGLSEVPTMLIAKIVNPVLLAATSKLKKNEKDIKNVLLSAIEIIMTFGMPVVALMILLSKNILTILYGSPFAIVALPFGILSMNALVFICSSVAMTLFIAMGRPDLQRIAAFVRTALFLAIIYPATLTLGLPGAAMATLCTMLCCLSIQLIYLCKTLKMEFHEYAQAFLTGLKLSLIVILPGVFLNSVFQDDRVVLSVGIILCVICWIRGYGKLAFMKALTCR